MQPLEDAKEFIGIPHIEPHPVVADEHDQLLVGGVGADLDPGFRAGAGIFQCVGEEVDQHLA